ncbi:MAG: hypothetical protein D6732_22520 [Methanobacteriota archaeon]|nr:MAG: hypothetical protein D6732_22520 [Euryarchaeota archaeon]
MSFAFYLLAISVIALGATFVVRETNISHDPLLLDEIDTAAVIGIVGSMFLAYGINLVDVVVNISSAEPASTLYVIRAIGIIVFPIGIITGYF